MRPSLILETMAAVGSFLPSIRSRYPAHVLLLKVNRAGFQRAVRAGKCLREEFLAGAPVLLGYANTRP